jgi:hypothetical protein
MSANNKSFSLHFKQNKRKKTAVFQLSEKFDKKLKIEFIFN